MISAIKQLALFGFAAFCGACPGPSAVAWRSEKLAAASQLAFSLHETDKGRKLLAAIPLSRFEPANNNTYDVARDFVRRFAAEVRPPDGR